MTVELRVELETLDYSDLQEALFNGKPFTGVAYSKDGSEIDAITYEVTFVDGIENGPYKSWYSTGELQAEGSRNWGAEDSRYLRYFVDGRINMDAVYYRGRTLVEKIYNEQGVLVKKYEGDFSLTGTSIEYFPSGKEKLKMYKEFGILVRKVEWDETGNVINEYKL